MQGNEEVIQVIGADTAPVFYINSANIRSGLYDIEILLSRVDTWGSAPAALVQVRIVMSPQHAKAMAKIMSDNIERYEKTFGPLKTEAELLVALNDLPLPASTEPEPPSSRSRSAPKPKV